MFKFIRRLFALIVVLIVILGGIMVYNTMQYKPPALADAEPFDLGADTAAAAQNLAKAVQFQTVSTDLTQPAFPDFLAFLEDTYPNVHATMERELLPPNTPLYKWQGSDPSLPPVMLAAHYDVVPVNADSLDQWTHDPFSGDIDEEFVWGRGTLDDKGAVIGILTAAEQLIGEGFTPKRTIYLSFGGDEEIGGTGAKAVADHLTAQGVKLAWVLDEGSFVLDGIIPGLDQPVASINLSEKGYLTLTLVTEGAGGHSSLPPRVTAVGQLARAIARLQASPVPGGLTGVSGAFFDNLGRYFSFGQRMVFANRWLLNPVLENILSGSPATDAMLRTTTAPTMLSGSEKDNVLPTEARGTINFRLHPRDSVEGIIEHVRETVNDPGVEIVVDRENASEASPVASAEAQGYKDIEASILAAFGPVATVPGLTIAATDARHYAMAAENAYRINPFQITGEDLERFHGIDERLSLENLERGVNFYGALISRQ